MKVQLQGEWVESPIGVAPTAMQRMADFEGELATAKGKHSTQMEPFNFFPFQPVQGMEHA